MDRKKFDKMMDRVKEMDKHRHVMRDVELVPKFLELLMQLKEICMYEQKQRHRKGKEFKFKFCEGICDEYVVTMTVENKETVISIMHVCADDSNEVRTVRCSDAKSKPYVDVDEDIECMDRTIDAYFAAKESGNI